MTLDMAFGGSSNTVLHLTAIAHEAEADITLDDWAAVSAKTPNLVRISPASDLHMEDLYVVGGIPTIMRELDAPRACSRAMRSPSAARPPARSRTAARPADGRVVHTAADAYYPEGGLRVLRGNIAPDGAVVKQSAVPKEMRQLHRPGPRVRLRGERGRRDPRRQDRRRRRRRHPLRGPQGRARYARDAHADLGDQRHAGAGHERRAHHRRPLLRRHEGSRPSATSRPRPPRAGRSRSSPRATPSPSTSTPRRSRCTSTMPSWTAGAPHGRHRRLVSDRARWRATRSWSRVQTRGRCSHERTHDRRAGAGEVPGARGRRRAVRLSGWRGASRSSTRSTTPSKIRTILPRHEQGAVHAADGYARATGRCGVALVTSGPGATNTVTGLANAYMDSIPMVVLHRPGRLDGHRHRRVPGVRHHRHHAAGHQAQLPGQGRRRDPGGHARGVPHRHDRAARARCSSTFRPTSASTSWTSSGPRRSTCPATSPRTKGHSKQIKQAASYIARARRPLLYAGGGVLTSGGSQGAQGARRAHAAAGRHHADGQGRLSRRPPPVHRHARHARRQVHELHDHRDRPAHRGRRALRRPRDRQALGVREQGQGHPRRHRPRRDRQEQGGRRADRGRRQAGARRTGRRAAQDRRRAQDRGVDARDRRLAQAVPAALRRFRRGHPSGVRGPGHRASFRRTRSA